MSKGTTFDPFELMPFTGYIEPATGRQEQYLSLAHFIYSERLVGLDEQYRRYLLQLKDAELFRLEVDGVGLTGQGTAEWDAAKGQLLYAGIFMQALSNRERYGDVLANAGKLSIANCSFSKDAAAAMGQFISDVRNPQDKLKVVFLGSCSDQAYVDSCLRVIFGRRAPHCLLSLEDEGCSLGVSTFARKTTAPFSQLSASLSEEAVVESIQRRCTHVFHFNGAHMSDLTSRVLDQLNVAGVIVTPIQPKP